MMMFQANAAFALALIALASGAQVLIRSDEGSSIPSRVFSKLLAYVIMIASILSLICTSINAYRSYKSPPQTSLQGSQPFAPLRMMTGNNFQQMGSQQPFNTNNQQLPSGQPMMQGTQQGMMPGMGTQESMPKKEPNQDNEPKKGSP